MTDGELGELLSDCPTLYHMAARGSWPLIQHHGLLGTRALLDLFEVRGERREAILAQRRPEGVRLEHPDLGEATVRDQKPMSDRGLEKCLGDGMTPEAWYRLLNERAFLSLSRQRLLRLLQARPYRDDEHDVIEVAAAPLVDAYRDRITLAPINTGFTARYPAPRGADTFLSIEDYPYAHWRGKRARGERVVELAVSPGVPDIARFVRRVVRMRRDEELDLLWTGPEA
ncbi:DUF7002 family protein [Aureimonas jatrophae]|jgi:hypothetical protein|uniref:Uncharacterized protein n=1 Tax=Aureimonas jatrophae TaxID=1166073 RepID=A0A1H0LWP3_9HYPH|nr:hypothetical protein [Aureimonas jatrophae]MBB3952773.1 hypothetical protein [Aureimonas jatrophae]SDO72360.1 hypothetical protein SAMN05192530_11182 [Aureimonas jatrophae]